MSDELRDNEKLYGDRDPCEQDELGNYFVVHMHHMTTENLHNKAEIAEELAHRDIEIARLQSRNLELEKEVISKFSAAWKEGFDDCAATQKDDAEEWDQMTDRIEVLEADRKRDCVEFFRWFWNAPGTNAEQGYDVWTTLAAAEINHVTTGDVRLELGMTQEECAAEDKT